MKKEICASNDVLRLMDEAVANYNANHKKGITSDSRVHVARVMVVSKQNDCRTDKASKRSNAPFLCFMKRASCNKTIIVGLGSEQAKIISNASLVIKHKDMETFSLNGVRYKLKENNGNLPRFAVMHGPSRPKMNKVEEIDF
jgi:hypothetical protein